MGVGWEERDGSTSTHATNPPTNRNLKPTNPTLPISQTEINCLRAQRERETRRPFVCHRISGPSSKTSRKKQRNWIIYTSMFLAVSGFGLVCAGFGLVSM